jgi:hypothetical protein
MVRGRALGTKGVTLRKDGNEILVSVLVKVKKGIKTREREETHRARRSPSREANDDEEVARHE